MPKKLPVNEIISLTRQGYTDADIIKYLRSQGYNSIEINDAINQAKIKMELAKTAGIEYSPEAEEMPQVAMPEGYVPEAETEAETEEMRPSIMEQEEAVPEEIYAPVPTAEAEEAETEGKAEYAPAPTEEVPIEYYPPTVYPETAPTEAIEELAEEIINEKWEEFKAKIGDISELKSYIESRLKQIEDRVKRLEMNFDKIQLSVMGQVQQYSREIKSLGTEMQALEGAFSNILQPLVSSVKELKELTEEIKEKKPVTKKIEKVVKKLEEKEKIKKK